MNDCSIILALDHNSQCIIVLSEKYPYLVESVPLKATVISL
jgi:hypothetical protein